PTVAVALLTASLGLPQAIALVLIPAFLTNVWQALAGGHTRALAVRLWPFLIPATLTVWIGATALARVDARTLSAVLGVLLMVYATVNLANFRLALSPRQERWAGPLVGAVNGVFTGMTGSFTVPGVMYLQSIGLSRDALIQAMGMLFTLSTVALAVALSGNNLLTREIALASLIAMIPVLIGVAAGSWMRQRLSEAAFLRAFFLSLLALGLYIIVAAAR
ncbi:MAG: sulfite exporter TauE/SafE family protein, partial [Chitinophagales bacterium]|nr:sulfite exporter TauE/SafE family protein [Hyphomicrobiales bacterium]